MKSLTENEKQVLTIVTTNARTTFRGIAQKIGMKYRGVQDLVARLVLDGYLLRTGHGRGQRLHVTDKTKQIVGEVAFDVPKRESRVVPVRHLEPDYDTMTYPELVAALNKIERFWLQIKGESHPGFIWRELCEPRVKIVEAVFRRWPGSRGVPLGREVEALAYDMRDFYFGCTCAVMAREREYVFKLIDVLVAAPADKLAEFYKRLNGVPGALIDPKHLQLLKAA